MTRLSELTGRRVVDEDGRVLGRVVEVRSPGAPETRPRDKARTVGSLLFGYRGLLERLGWAEPDTAEVDWREVDVLDAGPLRIDAGALDATRARHAAREQRKAAARVSAQPQPTRAEANRAPPGTPPPKQRAKQRKAATRQGHRAQKGAPGTTERKE